MRILQLCPTMQRAGTWYRSFYLSRALAQRGHDVTLVKISAEHRIRVRRSEEEGIHLVETPRFWGSSISHHNTRLPSDVLARMWLVLAQRFDIIQTFSHHINAMLPGILARHVLRNGTLVADWDDLWTEGGIYGDAPSRGLGKRLNYAIDHWSEVHLKGWADAVTVVSEDLRSRAIRDGVPSDRIFFIPNGAPVDTIKPAAKGPLRRELELPAEVPVLVFTGYGQFDIDLALDAVRLLHQRGVSTFTVITGPHPELVSRAVEERGLQDAVRVTGVVPYTTLCKYLAAADVGLVPYADKPLNRARWPIKLGDYLAAGLAVATCKVGEMGRVVTEWNVGTATEPSPTAFAQGIEELVATPSFGPISARARQAAEGISWDAVAANLERCFERATSFRRDE